MPKKYKYLEYGIVWTRRQCGAHNLHPLDGEEFDCINCKYVLMAAAHPEVIKREIKD